VSGPRGYGAAQCPHCAEWNAPQAPRKIFGNTYWVGTLGLGSILVVGSGGDVLIDGGLPESAPQIEAHIRALGLRVEDVKLILKLAPVATQFEHSFDVIEHLPCDVLLTPHPSASDLWERPSFVDPDACKRLVSDARAGLQKRLESERH
jgi:hypothetical protein